MTPKPRTLQARTLRRNATEAERRLWWALRNAKLPWKVRRQHPIDRFFVDFAIPACKLAIEVDGGQHAENMQDAEREAALAMRGWRVVRFWNHDVLQNTEGVLSAIRLAAEHRPSG